MMIIENTKLKKSDIFAGKLISGEEIIGRVVDITASAITFSKPLMITLIAGPNMNQPAIAPVPWVLGVPDDASITIDLSKFFFVTRARSEIINSYTRATTGIEIPQGNLGNIIK